MDSINGIPLIWDNEGDKNLFGKLFNQGSLVPNLPVGNKFPQFPVNNDITTLSPKAIGNKYYGNNPIYDSKGVTVFSDDELPPNTIQLKEVKIYDNDFYKEFKDFSFTLFVSKNGARLLTQYKECEVFSNEIALFLEIDDETNFTGSVMEAKVGAAVNQSKLPIAQMLAFMRENRVNLKDSDIIKLINGAFSSRNSLIHWLYSAVIRGATGITTFIFDSLDAINQGIISVFDALVIDEKHWNADAKEYSNFFVPAQLLELLKTNNNDSKIAEAILLPITLQINGIEKGIASSLKLVEPILPSAIYNNLDKNLKLKFKEIDVFLEHIKQDSFLEFVKTATEVANAYLCGFINSIIEFFKGIFEIIGIVLNMLKTFVISKVDPLYYTGLLAEIFENIIGVIVNFDLKQFIINAFTYPLVLLQKIFVFVKNTNFNIEGIKINLSKIGYISGYIIGLVVAIIIDALLTGGVKAAQDIIKALQTFLTKPGTVLKDLLQTAGRKTVAVVETVIDLIATLARKLKNGAIKLFEDFKQFIDDVFKWLEELFNSTKGLRNESKIILGTFSKRSFDINNCGGKILNLIWEDAKITKEGIKKIKLHLSRFEDISANKKMIERLEKIESGKLEITNWDKRFFTHETREFERYKNLGYESTKNDLIPENVWNDAHSATLEDYKLLDRDVNNQNNLYHPEIKEIDFISDQDKKLLGF